MPKGCSVRAARSCFWKPGSLRSNLVFDLTERQVMATFRALVLGAIVWASFGLAQASAQDAIARRALVDICLYYVAWNNGSLAEAQARASAFGYTYDPADRRWELGLYSVELGTVKMSGGGEGEYQKWCRFISQSSAVPPVQIRLAVEDVFRSSAPLWSNRTQPSWNGVMQWTRDGIDPVSGRYDGARQCTSQSTSVTFDDGQRSGFAPRFSVESDLQGCTAAP